MYGLDLIPWDITTTDQSDVPIIITLGGESIRIKESIETAEIISQISELSRVDIKPDDSVLVIDFGISESIDSLNLSPSDQSESIFDQAYNYIKAFSNFALRCYSITVVRIVKKSNDKPKEVQLFESLCTGALRSLQSEQPNLKVVSLNLNDSDYSYTVLKNIIDNICCSVQLPSDLYIDDEGKLLVRATISMRESYDLLAETNDVNEWKSVYVFGGASAITIECLSEVVSTGSQVHLFGRRTYERIEDKIDDVFNINDLQKYVLSNETDSKKDLATLRSRIHFLQSQIELSSAIRRLNSRGASVHYHKCDITSLDDVKGALLEVEAQGGAKPSSVLFSAGTLRDALMTKCRKMTLPKWLKLSAMV